MIIYLFKSLRESMTELGACDVLSLVYRCVRSRLLKILRSLFVMLPLSTFRSRGFIEFRRRMKFFVCFNGLGPVKNSLFMPYGDMLLRAVRDVHPPPFPQPFFLKFYKFLSANSLYYSLLLE